MGAHSHGQDGALSPLPLWKCCKVFRALQNAQYTNDLCIIFTACRWLLEASPPDPTGVPFLGSRWGDRPQFAHPWKKSCGRPCLCMMAFCQFCSSVVMAFRMLFFHLYSTLYTCIIIVPRVDFLFTLCDCRPTWLSLNLLSLHRRYKLLHVVRARVLLN